MKIWPKFTLALPLLLFSCSSDEPSPVVENPAEGNEWELTPKINLTASEIAEIKNMTAFTDNLIATNALTSDDGSFCISPVSVSILLNILANSSTDQLQQSIVDALGVDNLEAANSLSTKLLQYLPCEQTGVKMLLNNRVWVADQYTVPQAFTGTMASVFNAEVQSIDFTNSAHLAGINDWVSKCTNGIIDGIVQADSPGNYALYDAMAANTVYFLGDWADKFDPAQTTTATFATPDGNIQVPMMHNTIVSGYASDDTASLVEIPFKGNHYVMDIYLPDSEIAAKDIATAINADVRAKLDGQLKRHDITLSLPRFSSASVIPNLNDVLESMGVTGLGSADLSPMGVNRLSDIIIAHKAKMTVNEDGAELAAVTYFGSINATLDELTPVSVTIDRPFMYMVRNTATGTIILAGVVTNP